MAISQNPVSSDGVAIDTLATAQRAKERVDRDEYRVPIHACGLVSHSDCPCWTCTAANCAACFASMY